VTDPHEDDKINADGMMRFLDDLGLNPESRTVLILAWKFGAATQCVFTKEEFVNGLMELGYVTEEHFTDCHRCIVGLPIALIFVGVNACPVPLLRNTYWLLFEEQVCQLF